MSEAKHTPGPWLAGNLNWRGEPDAHGNLYVSGDFHTDDEGGYATAVCRVEGNRTSGPVTAANAALIVAAPGMHRELLETADWLEERAAVVEKLPVRGRWSAMGAGNPAQVEAARLRGRAVLIRLAAAEAATS